MTPAKARLNASLWRHIRWPILLISLSLIFLVFRAPTEEPQGGKPPIPPVANRPVQRLPQPVDLSALAQRLNAGPPPLTSEQAKEEEKLIAAQVADAAAALENIDPAERLGGAEQLAAYPTAEAEKLLAHTLETDMEKEVRQAAAVSLGYVKKPRKETIQTLLMSLADPDEEVRSAALETLQRYVAHDEHESARSRQIVKALKDGLGSKNIPNDIREDIREWMADQTAN